MSGEWRGGGGGGRGGGGGSCRRSGRAGSKPGNSGVYGPVNPARRITPLSPPFIVHFD